MEKNLVAVMATVCDLKLEFHKVNEVPMGTDTYAIDFEEFKGGDWGICLMNSKKATFGLSDYQLAALRLVTDAADVTCEYVSDFKDLPKADRFQNVARKMRDESKSIANVRFQVVAQLKIRNEQVPGQPIYQSKYYTGYAAYHQGLSDFKVGKGKEYYKLPEYGIKKRELSNIMHATAVRDGKATPENLELIPVFKIVAQ